MVEMNKQWRLVSRPEAQAGIANFRLDEAPLAPLADGEFRVRSRYLSVDPYMRGRMNDQRSYAKPQPLGAVMQGGAVGEVIETRHPGFTVGERVVGYFGWQLYATSDGRGVEKIANSRIPMSTYLGCVGMPGRTAWYGMNRIIKPKAGETIVVSAASGAVGSVAGQLAARAGARAVGIAGGAEKCRVVTDEFGFAAAVDYKSDRFLDALAAATPDRIDGNFENVGGAVWDAILARMNAFGRIAVCGLISGYDRGGPPLVNYASILINRLSVQGFIVGEHAAEWREAPTELADLVERGELHYRESISHGIESVPKAFLGLFHGQNLGKQLVELD